ncbi:response regulator [Oleomonas cavernae]|uniref:histidine kinase n=1 Tax=Oleomonas cavernae TaxID=2320859 RepID=A0A418WEY7_9PROT|nr:ATP-binding protein [Oleomonas cavernae]RJF88576.1 response regulator [Oleomonas cavernae]
MTRTVDPVQPPPAEATRRDRAVARAQEGEDNVPGRLRALLWPMAGFLMAFALLIVDLFFDLQMALAFGLAAAAVIVLGALSVHHHMGEIERRRQALTRAGAQANEANRAKSQFLAVMSHELRTPMTGMIGTLDLLRETSLTPAQRRLTETLAGSSTALLTVLNDILDFSKIEAGMLQIETLDFRLCDSLGATLNLFRAQAERKGIRLVGEIATDVPPVIRSDPTRLRQILTNLIGNAVKFTDSGQVDVRVVKTGESPLRLRFEIQDTGVGISSEKQAALFQPFVQADAHTSRRFGGTGLGLAICSRLAAAMGGRIGLTSAIGLGSCFWFTITTEPGLEAAVDSSLAEEADPERATPPPAQARPAGGRLLVAEDNDVNRFLIEEHLRRRGYDVTMVEHGWAAVEAHRAQAFDIVLLDMRMPVMDGPTATKRIRALPPPACNVPIIALTADAMRDDAQRYLRSGIDALHTKPIDWDSLDLTIRRFLEDGGSRPKAPVLPPRPPGQAVDSQVDTQTIARLRQVMGDGGMVDLIAAFRATLANEGAKLHAAAAGQAAREVREAAHAIQGMAAELGARGVADIARTIRIDGAGALNGAALAERLESYDAMVAATLRRLDLLAEEHGTASVQMKA